MKRIFLYLKRISDKIEVYLEKHFLSIINLLISYLVSYILVCIIWYIYELVFIGNLNQNSNDTNIALLISFLLMIPMNFVIKKVLSHK